MAGRWVKVRDHRQFDHAQISGKKQFCFVIDDDQPWPPKMIEDEPGRSKLSEFKKKVRSMVVTQTFTDPDDLATKIVTSIGRYLVSDRQAEAPSRAVTSTTGGLEDLLRKIIRSELQGMRLDPDLRDDLRPIVNRWSDRLQFLEKDAGVQAIDEKLPPDLEGCWRDSVSGSTLYARFMGEDLVVPYSYGNSPRSLGVFFDFERRSEDVFIARFRWTDSPIRGFAYMERSGPERASGGWWHSRDVPGQALEDLRRLGFKLPRMNVLELSRLPLPAKLPQWANDIFSIPRDKLLDRLRTDG